MATIRERLDDSRGGKGGPPLWTVLRDETPRPFSVNVDVGIEEDDLKALLDAGGAQHLWNSALECLDADLLAPSTLSSLTSPPVVIETTPEFRHSAQTELGSDAAGVLLSQGLDILLLSVAMPIAYALPGRDRRRRGPAAEVIALWLTRQIGWLTSVAGRPYAAPLFPDEEQMRIARAYFIAAKRFVLLHELAHILFAHGTDRPAVGHVRVRELEPRPEWRAELEADELALSLLVACALFDETSWAGISLFFHAESWVEAHAPSFRPTSHPPAMHRLDSLRRGSTLEALKTTNPSAYADWTQWERRLTRTLRRVGRRVVEKAPDAVGQDGRTWREYWEERLEQQLGFWRGGGTAIFADDWARDAESVIHWAPSIVLAAIKRRLNLARSRHTEPMTPRRFARLEKEERALTLLVSRLPRDVRLSLGVRA